LLALPIMARKAAVLGLGGGKLTGPPTNGVNPVRGVRPVLGVKPVRGVRPVRKEEGSNMPPAWPSPWFVGPESIAGDRGP
jgi:hypothetical protein